jgi:hypothetical protein
MIARLFLTLWWISERRTVFTRLSCQSRVAITRADRRTKIMPLMLWIVEKIWCEDEKCSKSISEIRIQAKPKAK